MSHLWNGTEQLVDTHVSIGAWFEDAACEFVVSPLELREEDLVVVVGVEQAADVTGELVQPGQPHPLLTTNTTGGLVGVITLFNVQLGKKITGH